MAITQNYVDYGAGSDTTGDGTIGTPWKTLQKAFDTLVRNTTDGNQVNLKAGTAHVNSAALDLTTFIAGGALAAVAPLILRGYTSAANDGGMGEIDCGGNTMWAATTYDYIVLADLDIHSGGNNNLVVLDDYCLVYRCKFHKGASSPSGKYLLTVGYNSTVIGCALYDPGAGSVRCISMDNVTYVIGNYCAIGAEATTASYGIYGNAGVYMDNVVLCADTDHIGIVTLGVTMRNIVYNTTAGTNHAIASNVTTPSICVVANNILCGFSGANGEGVNQANVGLIGFNAFWNNTASYTTSDIIYVDLTANDVALAADPFTDAANGDFSLTAAAKTALAAKGFPQQYLGAHANTVSNLNIGPIQMAASSGGGRPAFGDRSGGKF